MFAQLTRTAKYLQKTQLIARLLLFRIFIGVFVISNTHKPDEWFQGPEVAHNIVYGSGLLTWEWTFQNPLRNPTFPLLLAFPLYFLKFLHIDTPFLVSLVPSFVQSLIAAAYDYLLIKLNKKYNPTTSTGTVLLLSYSNWVSLMYFSRFYVNSLEAVLTLGAFLLWLDRYSSKSKDMLSRAIVIFCFCMRGTSVLFWAVVWPYELIVYHSSSIYRFLDFIQKNVLTLIMMVCCSVMISLMWYGKPTWVQYNFFRFNILQGWANLFGTRPFHFYFTLYPAKIFFGNIIFILYALLKVRSTDSHDKYGKKESNDFKELITILLGVLLLMSVSSHKQLRFMLPVMPLLTVLLVKGYTAFPNKLIKNAVFGISSVFALFFFVTRSCIYKRGAIEVAKYLQNTQPARTLLYVDSYDIPMYSYVHPKPGSLISIPDGSFVDDPSKPTQLQKVSQFPYKYWHKYSKEQGTPDVIVIMEEFNLTVGPEYHLVKKVWHPSPMDWHRNLLIYQLSK